MRVIAGSARRLLLKAPLGDNTRPTTDRIKETLFNMIQNEKKLQKKSPIKNRSMKKGKL